MDSSQIKTIITSSAAGSAISGVGGAVVFIAAGGTAMLLPPIMIGAGFVVGGAIGAGIAHKQKDKEDKNFKHSQPHTIGV